ncbi:MAG: prepilin-type N-terminal cleavage/methylation domain-containing protein [Alphaproteobacteria bacterium]|nr:prepilin-type N-terminal cleavage/methylation domain-containing protein [Alphaproteobacteria bacterium]
MKPVRRPRKPQPKGFTLIELMVSSAIGLALLVSVYGIFYQSIGMSDAMHSQITTNQNAREIFHMLADGGTVLVSGTTYTEPGMRGRNYSGTDTVASYMANGAACTPIPPSNTCVFSQLLLSDALHVTPDPRYNIYSSSTFATNIVCSATTIGEPHRICDGTGKTITVVGPLADLTRQFDINSLIRIPLKPTNESDPLNLDVSGRAVTIPVKLINPAMANRNYTVTTAGNNDFVDRQTMVFRLQEAQRP